MVAVVCLCQGVPFVLVGWLRGCRGSSQFGVLVVRLCVGCSDVGRLLLAQSLLALLVTLHSTQTQNNERTGDRSIAHTPFGWEDGKTLIGAPL